ncbi:hypothetical protein [Mycobacterium malmoense]|uniref:hypothetical protein n=1 Tax=Mycobacterium malmoense TaxID=1780 RepID=UPI0008F96D71|nr:hypothetical protein [Mycobacterium malmoense]OIN80506.1 hypothetical protein BMG05_12140 [Mycobacterium malmoense]
MQQLTALRPLVAAGAAAVGASLIALTPAVSGDVAADLHRSAADIQQRAVQLLSTDPGVVNPIQTWVDVFQDAVANLQADYASATAYGLAPVLEQVLANQAHNYGTLVIPGFQESATRLVNLYTGAGFGGFWPNLFTGISQVGQGDFTDGFFNIANDGLPAFLNSFGLPLQDLLPLLPQELENLPNAVNFLLGNAYVYLTGQVGLSWPGFLGYALGSDVQLASDGFASGDLLAGVTNLLNIPGAFTGQFLNGFTSSFTDGFVPGLLSPSTNIAGGWTGGGLLYFFTTYVPQGTANSIVYPGAPNIVQGGDLAATVQQFLAQASSLFGFNNPLSIVLPNVVWAWPTPQTALNQLINLFQTYAGVGGLTSAATGASAADVAGIAPSLAANLGGIAPSIAADLSGLAPSIATNVAGMLGPELGTLAVNLLTSLF